MFNSKNALLALLIIGLGSALNLQAAQDGHYRWTDANGVVKYSDRPPKGIDSEFIKLSGIKRSKSEDPETTDTNNSAGETNKAETPNQLEVMPEKDPELCKQAQHNLKALEGARIRMSEPDGSKRFLTEEEKELQRENARKFIKVHC